MRVLSKLLLGIGLTLGVGCEGAEAPLFSGAPPDPGERDLAEVQAIVRDESLTNQRRDELLAMRYGGRQIEVTAVVENVSGFGTSVSLSLTTRGSKDVSCSSFVGEWQERVKHFGKGKRIRVVGRFERAYGSKGHFSALLRDCMIVTEW